MFEKHKQNVAKTWGALKNDSLDLEEIKRVIPSQLLNMHSSEPNRPIYRLKEPYPENGCENNGHLTSQTQTIYECKSGTVLSDDFFRVTF